MGNFIDSNRLLRFLIIVIPILWEVRVHNVREDRMQLCLKHRLEFKLKLDLTQDFSLKTSVESAV